MVHFPVGDSFLKAFLIAALLLFPLAASSAPQRILFVGNSYTAFSGPDSLEVSYGKIHMERHPEDASAVFKKHTVGGATLPMHLESALTGALKVLLAEGWDLVVLQDQSQVPGFPKSNSQWRESRDAAVALAALVEEAGAETRLFMTWGRRNGDSNNADLYPDYSSMQTLLAKGYEAYAEAIAEAGHSVEVVPVGEVWRSIHDGILADGGDPTEGDTLFTRLYVGDGSHPSRLGTYLAACSFYASLTGETPVGVAWAHEGIPSEDRDAVQLAASVLADSVDPVDTEEPKDTLSTDSGLRPEENMEDKGCGCTSSTRGASAWAFLGFLFLFRRRVTYSR
jgi:uncharacterized protein (TIGR03382 family)